MKVCLLFPRFIMRNYSTPLGVLYLASALRKSRKEFFFIDGTVSSEKEALETIMKEKPGIILVSLHSVFADIAFSLLEKIKKAMPKCKVIIGGPHASILPFETIKNNCVDAVMVGEGEKTITKIIESGFDAKKLKRIKGVLFKKKLKVEGSTEINAVENLDELAFPSIDLLSKEYFNTGVSTMITSRGCPFQCAFCQPTLEKLFGKKYRQRSVKNVIEEIKKTKAEFEKKGFKLNELHFTDDGLTYRHAWLEELCNALKKEKIMAKWTANTRADTLPGIELLQKMKNSGCTILSIGVESGNDFIRNEILKKNVSREKITNAFRLCGQAGIETTAFLMVGSPHETEKTILETLQLLDEIQPNNAQVSITSPLPKTFLYDYCEKKGMIEAKEWRDFAYTEQSPLVLENFSKSKIKKAQTAMAYAILAREAIQAKTRLKPKYSLLFKLFYASPFNQAMRFLQKARFKMLKTFKNSFKH